MPLHRLLHIAPCFLLLLAVFCACTEEEVVPVAPTRTLTVDLGITLTRATEGTSIGDGGQPKDLQLWIFDQDNHLLDYAAITDANDLFFSGSDALGELVNTIQRIVEVESTDGEVRLDLAGQMEDYGVSLYSEYGTIRTPQGTVESDDYDGSSSYIRLETDQDTAGIQVDTESGDIRIREN